ncbi:hypothetical protein DMC30DRAFT_18658 [Rhodotorula diobovata]|uniref:Uncharacterized protein n=1 Tax=Rhodotorula diobovata TaxID=5288 RepID=A0A5C5FQE8_9BASI|nr:hypothetical protein DMC30DRAFT_18658 [Rhodotorula diobovata]
MVSSPLKEDERERAEVRRVRLVLLDDLPADDLDAVAHGVGRDDGRHDLLAVAASLHGAAEVFKVRLVGERLDEVLVDLVELVERQRDAIPAVALQRRLRRRALARRRARRAVGAALLLVEPTLLALAPRRRRVLPRRPRAPRGRSRRSIPRAHGDARECSACWRPRRRSSSRSAGPGSGCRAARCARATGPRPPRARKSCRADSSAAAHGSALPEMRLRSTAWAARRMADGELPGRGGLEPSGRMSSDCSLAHWSRTPLTRCTLPMAPTGAILRPPNVTADLRPTINEERLDQLDLLDALVRRAAVEVAGRDAERQVDVDDLVVLLVAERAQLLEHELDERGWPRRRPDKVVEGARRALLVRVWVVPPVRAPDVLEEAFEATVPARPARGTARGRAGPRAGRAVRGGI